MNSSKFTFDLLHVHVYYFEIYMFCVMLNIFSTYSKGSELRAYHTVVRVSQMADNVSALHIYYDKSWA